jgi:cardiolipin synthase
VANLITLVRIVLTPVFILCLIQGYYRPALLIFLLAGLSDLADGLIARRFGQKTPLGAFLDPLADKLLVCSSFITLAIYRLVPAWLTVVVFSRDLILALGVLVFKLADYPLTIKPSWTGKWTTTFQLLSVFLVLLGKGWSLPGNFLQGCFWVTGVLTVSSGLHYMADGLRQVSQVQAERRQGNQHGPGH